MNITTTTTTTTTPTTPTTTDNDKQKGNMLCVSSSRGLRERLPEGVGECRPRLTSDDNTWLPYSTLSANSVK